MLAYCQLACWMRLRQAAAGHRARTDSDGCRNPGSEAPGRPCSVQHDRADG